MYNKRPILKNNQLQLEFDDKGFVKIKVFTEAEMMPMLACFDKYADAHFIKDGGFHHTTHHTNNWDLIAQVSSDLIQLMKPRMDEIFINYNILGGNFMVKDSGENTEFVPHQDWTLMDESKYYSANIWMPLHDLLEDMGTLHFLPSSHNHIKNLRMAPNFPELYGKVMPHIYPHLESVPLKLGEAVLFDCCVLHGSHANTSNQHRKSIIMGIYSNNAQFKFYYNTQQGNPPVIEEYHIHPDEFLTFAVGNKPNNIKPDRVFAYDFPVMTLEKFQQQYSSVV